MQMSQHTDMILSDPRNVVDLDVGKPVRWGMLLMLAGFGGFLLWSWMAPLAVCWDREDLRYKLAKLGAWS